MPQEFGFYGIVSDPLVGGYERLASLWPWVAP